MPSIAISSPGFSAMPAMTKRLDDDPSIFRVGMRSFAVHSPTILPPTLTLYRAAPVLTSKYCTAMSRGPAGPAYLKVAVHDVVWHSTAPVPDAVSHGVTVVAW